MITKDDMIAMSGWEYWHEVGETLPPSLYSQFVESMMLTKGHDRLMENTLGLVGEAGEVAEKVKKAVRGDKVLNHAEVMKELGDVLFYVTAIANHLGYSLDNVIDGNVEKLIDRKEKGKVRGDGDNR